ncbi:hypothetical protein [Gilvimarinus xylanilyticus]|uniref:Protein BatD n=1 Tax=Gilvimarinus xylanilyticus TaxID=2944139 RepID=A0A9X2I2F5_9GAMM|nr:hypothetical protein [Gilvimarinus xylanilyticus]MCP8899573.1 hypothetical protein [Gilvimarinus xylanilyticus]
MNRWILSLLLGFFCLSALAEPRVSSSVKDEQVMVGQLNTLSVKVLVPTWFTQSVYFDEVEAVNIISLAGNKSSYPVSESVNGQTWSGIVKDYTVVPMTAGSFTLNFPTLKLHYSGEDGKPQNLEVTPPPVIFNAYVPPAAQSLQPLIIAEDIRFEQSFSAPDQLTVGDSVSRSLTVRVSGSSSLFLPPLLKALEDESVSSYQQSPVSQDEVEGDRVNGVRTEQQDVLVKASGRVPFADIALRYYQPSSGEIVEVVAEGTVFEAAKPPATALQKLFYAVLALVGLLVLALLGLWLRKQYNAYLQTEPARFRRARHALAKPERASEQALHQWHHCWPVQYRDQHQRQKEFSALMLALEQRIYLPRAKVQSNTDLVAQLDAYRRALQQMQTRQHTQLQPLNP